MDDVLAINPVEFQRIAFIEVPAHRMSPGANARTAPS